GAYELPGIGRPGRETTARPCATLTRCVRAVVRPCLSPEVLAEYVEVLNRPKFGFDRDAIAAMLRYSATMVITSVRIVPKVMARSIYRIPTTCPSSPARGRSPRNTSSPATNGTFLPRHAANASPPSARHASHNKPALSVRIAPCRSPFAFDDRAHARGGNVE